MNPQNITQEVKWMREMKMQGGLPMVIGNNDQIRVIGSIVECMQRPRKEKADWRKSQRIQMLRGRKVIWIVVKEDKDAPPLARSNQMLGSRKTKDAWWRIATDDPIASEKSKGPGGDQKGLDERSKSPTKWQEMPYLWKERWIREQRRPNHRGTARL